MPPEEPKVSGDPAVASKLFSDFHELYRQWLDRASELTDKSFDLNKQVSSFHERLMLLDIGILGISISALISLGTRFASNPAARHIFVWYVAPSWVLLLLSVTACRNVMAFCIEGNRVMLQDWVAKLESYNLRQLYRTVTKLAANLSGSVTIDNAPRDVSGMFSDSAKLVQTALENQDKTPAPTSSAGGKYSKWQSQIAVLSMQIALVLLGIAAIRLFLTA
jgi:hypothetical protein